MKLKSIHYFTGALFFLFVIAHLTNHLFSLSSFDHHIAIMETLRLIYRNVIVETILMIVLIVQIVSGLKLFKSKRGIKKDFFENLQVLSGLYLAVFLIIHLSAVWAGRLFLKLDTNLYFGIAGLNSFPHLLFFIPYYSLAILAFFAHLAAVHDKKMKADILGLSPRRQAYGFIAIGILVVGLSMFGLTNGFKGADIPALYNVLVGK